MSTGKTQVKNLPGEEPQGEITIQEVIEGMIEEWKKMARHCVPGESRYFVVKTYDGGGNPIYVMVDVDGLIAVVCKQSPGNELTCSSTNDGIIVEVLEDVNGEVVDEGLLHPPCP